LYEHGTVVADIAKCRAEIEGARLLVLSAALQASFARQIFTLAHHVFKIDKHQAKGALKEIGVAKVCL
jgi:acyl-CoA dehydrogenase